MRQFIEPIVPCIDFSITVLRVHQRLCGYFRTPCISIFATWKINFKKSWEKVNGRPAGWRKRTTQSENSPRNLDTCHTKEEVKAHMCVHLAFQRNVRTAYTLTKARATSTEWLAIHLTLTTRCFFSSPSRLRFLKGNCSGVSRYRSTSTRFRVLVACSIEYNSNPRKYILKTPFLFPPLVRQDSSSISLSMSLCLK